MTQYLKLPDIALRLDVSQQTARRMVKDGRLPAVYIGNAYRVSEEDLAAYLENARVELGGGPTGWRSAPALELAELFGADPKLRQRALAAASTAEVARYLADLDRALTNAGKGDEDDTPDTRRGLVEYASQLTRMRIEAEAYAPQDHAADSA